jgi:hypothetical protein
MSRKILSLCFCISLAVAGSAQETSWRDFDFKLKAGFSIGGTSPMGIPAQVREIQSFSPLVSLSMEADAVYWLHPKWGVGSGIRFENKGMSTVARTKEYAMQVGELEGKFTGRVETKVKNEYLNIPLALHYRLLQPLNVHFGFYYAYLLEPLFSGTVSGGHLRTGNPGEETNQPMEAPELYSFSDKLNKHDFGLLGGVEWNAFRHLVVSFDLNWGLRSIFPKEFRGISFAMYNVYANVAFGYRY